ncbi:HelD family protein [Cellulomonas bogoriensis]|uniref:ATPase AAA n=1 Tax=Cellulomonas bogoriensis 69B4 = DSM 16987 TaxID=1386082 RepID=A0A0A0C339_9CELL|nr:ATP-binding domain-containing protein [Cellulomonas bogoriensis]KGM14437.1 ATPase AAA [Cellulomonas bogoriensis 69B4 = DSM 16987]
MAAILFNELRDTDRDDVLVVGPNATFLRYIARVLPELGEQRVVHLDLHRLMDADVSVSVTEEPRAAQLKGDERMCEVLARGLRQRVRVPREDVRVGFDGVPWSVTLSPAMVEGLLADLESTPYAEGRRAARKAIEGLVVREGRRTDRRAFAGPVKPRAVEIEAYVERVWPQLTPQAFLRDLFGSRERLAAAADGTLDDEELRLLRRPPAPRLAEQAWSEEDLPLLDFVADEIRGDGRTYAHIVVDEAQDLSPMQLVALRRRSRAGAMTIVGDIAQSTGPWARESWDGIVEALASPLPRRVEQLRFGYRVPRAVMELAARLLPDAAPGVDAPEVVTGVDRPPTWTEAVDGRAMASAVVSAVQRHSARGLFVGVVCPDEHRERVVGALKEAQINWSDAEQGGLTTAINVVRPAAAKGLEFDAVVVVDPHTIAADGTHGLRMLYVALTRTTGYLDIVHHPGRVPAPLLDQVHVAEAPDVTPVDQGAAGTAPGATRRDLRGQGRQSGSSPVRRTVVDANAHHVLDLLTEVAPRHLWAEILDHARHLAEPDDPDVS